MESLYRRGIIERLRMNHNETVTIRHGMKKEPPFQVALYQLVRCQEIGLAWETVSVNPRC